MPHICCMLPLNSVMCSLMSLEGTDINLSMQSAHRFVQFRIYRKFRKIQHQNPRTYDSKTLYCSVGS
jgi:hypothetical protein